MTLSPVARTRNSSPAQQPPPAEGLSPGRIFAQRVADSAPGSSLTVPLRMHLPAAFPLFSTRPRYAVRHLLKTRDSLDAQSPFVQELNSTGAHQAGQSYASTPEFGYSSRLQESATTDLEVTVPLPAGIRNHPDVLANFVDFRVLVRVSVLENQTLLHGSADGVIGGLFVDPAAQRRRVTAIDENTLCEMAAAVEEMGGSCDGAVIHPEVYWRLVSTGALDRLGAAGMMLSRTRMMPATSALLSDFRATATLNVPQVASISLLANAGRRGEDLVRASTRLGLDVHLPHYLLRLDSIGDQR